jgi:polyisoprenoid-binding protein YceI
MIPGVRGAAWLAGAALLASATLAFADQVDSDASRVGFELHTRWGQALHGQFRAVQGEVRVRPDGLREVHLALQTQGVEIAGHPGYTRFARGSRFFDVERWPVVAFESDPYPPALLQRGGTRAGALTIRGVTRRETFVIQPSACERPAVDCDVVAGGVIDRGDYGMGHWRVAISDAVEFHLRIRLRGAAA